MLKRAFLQRHMGSISVAKLIVFFWVIVGIWMVNSPLIVAKTLKVAVMEAKPFGFRTPDNQIAGISYEVQKRIVEEAGFFAEIRLLPSARVPVEIESGESDVTLMFANEKIQQTAIKIAPVTLLRNVVVGLAGTRFTSLEDLHGKTVCLLRGPKFDEAFVADKAIIKYELSNYKQAIRMMMAKRIDAVAGIEWALWFQAKELNYSRDMFGEPLVLNTKPLYLFISKKTADAAVIEALRAAVERLNAQGVVQDLESNYLRGFWDESRSE